MGRTTLDQLSKLVKETDGTIWIPAKYASFYTGTWTDTRVAAGDYCMRKTAADNAGQTVFYIGSHELGKIGADPNTGPSIPGGGKASDIRGCQITSIDVVYQVTTTTALDAHTYDLHENTYANNVANAVVSTAGGTLTGTLATAIQTNPYVTRITCGTPFVIGGNTALRSLVLEISWDAAAATVLSYYGIFVNVNYNL